MMFKITVDYAAGVYGDIHEVFEKHEDEVRSYAALVEANDLHGGEREYIVETEDDDGWTARGLAEEIDLAISSDGWPTELERVREHAPEEV